MSDPHGEDDLAVEPGYDPWDAVDVALDAGVDPHEAHDLDRRETLEWFYAESAESRVVYLRDYDEKRKADPARRAYMRRYMRDYRRRRKLLLAA